MSQTVALPFSEISQAIKKFSFPPTDWVLGIGRGGIVPASIVAHQLGCSLAIVQVNYRDDQNQPVYENPVWLNTKLPKLPPETHILLVDDVSVTGKTLKTVKAELAEYRVTTFVLKGKADLVVFPDIGT
ncbi:MAG: phosphoribosyltransferase family protein, partial [Bacteroidota bacterium]